MITVHPVMVCVIATIAFAAGALLTQCFDKNKVREMRARIKDLEFCLRKCEWDHIRRANDSVDEKMRSLEKAVDEWEPEA